MSHKCKLCGSVVIPSWDYCILPQCIKIQKNIVRKKARQYQRANRDIINKRNQLRRLSTRQNLQRQLV